MKLTNVDNVVTSIGNVLPNHFMVNNIQYENWQYIGVKPIKKGTEVVLAKDESLRVWVVQVH